MVTVGTPATLAAKAATATVPIVFAIGVDPVQFGLAASLNHPGGNLTGVAVLSADLAAKKLEVLHELVPTTASIALLSDPTNVYTYQDESRIARNAAQVLGVGLVRLNASRQGDIPAAFATLVEQRIGQ